jgi:diaminopimelate decarboxylase
MIIISRMNKDVTFAPREDVLRAVGEFETPFFLYSEARIRENCRRFRGAFEKHFPDFAPLYAVKANSNPDVLRIIIDEGFEMDASSETEVWLSEKLGVGGMYTGNYTPASTLKFAKEHGFLLNLDDLANIPMLQEIGLPEFVSLRINPGIGDAVEESCVLAGPDAKYGAPFEKAAEAYRALAELGVKGFGIHIMTGSNVPIEQQNYFAEIVEKLFDVMAVVRDETGVEIELMNIGGGFGVPYRPEEESLDLEAMALSVREVFDRKCKEHGLKEPRLMAEPGRLIVADAGWLVGKVQVIKDGYKKFVGVDFASNDNPRPAIYGAYHHCSVLNDVSETEKVTVVGTICENNDQLAKDRELPICSVGDVVVLHNSGGHAFAMGHNYNGKLRHAEILLREDGKLEKVREEERFEDLYCGTRI